MQRYTLPEIIDYLLDTYALPSVLRALRSALIKRANEATSNGYKILASAYLATWRKLADAVNS